MRLSICLLLSLTFSTSLLASEQVLVSLRNDLDADTTQIVIETDSSNEVIKLHKDTLSSSGDKSRESFKTEVLDSGITLEKREGRDIVKLNNITFSPESGGDVQIDYLANGITNARTQSEFTITNNNGNWALHEKASYQEVKTMFLESRKVIGQVVGIKKIHINK